MEYDLDTSLIYLHMAKGNNARKKDVKKPKKEGGKKAKK